MQRDATSMSRAQIGPTRGNAADGVETGDRIEDRVVDQAELTDTAGGDAATASVPVLDRSLLAIFPGVMLTVETFADAAPQRLAARHSQLWLTASGADFILVTSQTG